MEYKVDPCSAAVGFLALVYDIVCIPLFVKLFWNELVPVMIDGVHEITYKQAWIIVMASITIQSAFSSWAEYHFKDELKYYFKSLCTLIQQRNDQQGQYVQPYNYDMV
jgi:hypothetical protein